MADSSEATNDTNDTHETNTSNHHVLNALDKEKPGATVTDRYFSHHALFSGIPHRKEETQKPRRSLEKSVGSTHALRSKVQGESEAERLTKAIETRRAERIPVMHDVQITLIEDCREIAQEKGYPSLSHILISDLLEYREQVREDHNKQKNRWVFSILRSCRFRDQTEQLLKVLDRAVELVEITQAKTNIREFHYMDFIAYYTMAESRWPWMRHGSSVALIYVILFYLFTPIFFCYIVKDQYICPPDHGHHFAKWVGAFYFASASLSTVGYGDLTVDLDQPAHVFAGIVYMIIANVTLIGSFSLVADHAWNPMHKMHEDLVEKIMGNPKSDEPMHKRLRRLKFLRLTEIIGGFVLLNLVGVFANRIFLLYDPPHPPLTTDWTWLTSVYWAVQTTTTIGYGDLDMPTNGYWFQVVYLIFSTYFVGVALNAFVGLRDEMEKIRLEYNWARREISKNLIDEVQPEDHDGKVDQYEFLIASLVSLRKISSEDVVPIMDKFRSLAGDGGFITANEVKDATDEEIQGVIDEASPRIPLLNRRLSSILSTPERRSGGHHHHLRISAGYRSSSSKRTGTTNSIPVTSVGGYGRSSTMTSVGQLHEEDGVVKRLFPDGRDASPVPTPQKQFAHFRQGSLLPSFDEEEGNESVDMELPSFPSSQRVAAGDFDGAEPSRDSDHHLPPTGHDGLRVASIATGDATDVKNLSIHRRGEL
ncbi:Two pore potassium channel [Seminavis robusta]|uniref:Two pore potassium channel n=1 Tax=Seminavis robusta TaxID=568900 RepID=A0A9N8EHP7_9STRA|nr:Two pore potassium channel [Seminavis robusta]|eukprot:Sro1118_g243050.1 Two pore potassium channel (706) ;mRNA; f:7303-10082